jgi:D-alanyl-D-alanine carboxypeptidase/D-alanyl-D-alanine-endopeptidase (penicillin-binding protein 4)
MKIYRYGSWWLRLGAVLIMSNGMPAVHDGLHLPQLQIAAQAKKNANQKSRRASDSMPALEKLQRQGARVSALVVNLESNENMAVVSADELLTPASVTKLVLAATLLERFGPDYTFKTRVLTEGSLRGDTLDGDLIIQPGGDPGLTNEYLWRLATDVARLGIRKINGNIVLETGLFANIPVSDRDTNRAVGASGSNNAYDSPLSAAAVNFSVLGVFVAPGQSAGQPAAVALEPYPMDSVSLINEVKTVANGAPSRIEVSRSSRAGRDVVTANGTIAADAKPRTVYRSVSDPDRYALDVYGGFLGAAGVTFSGKKVRSGLEAKKESGREVLVLESQPLEWQLRGLLRYSNNFLADMLTIHLDEENTTGKTLAGGSNVLSAYLAADERGGAANREAATLSNSARQGKQPRIESGSGLTPENRLSARDLTKVLKRVYANGLLFGHLYAALPGAGHEGTLRDRFGGASEQWLQGQLRAKTGTLTEPVVAVGLAGFSRTKAGQWAAFGIIVNGAKGSSGVTVGSARAAIDQDLGRILSLN